MSDIYVKVHRWSDRTDETGKVSAVSRNGFFLSKVYGIDVRNEDDGLRFPGTYFLVYDDGTNVFRKEDLDYCVPCFIWLRVTTEEGLPVTMFDPKNELGKATVEMFNW